MQFCMPHWTKLREAIEAEGIGHLIARDGSAAISNMVSEIETGSRRENFCPLMASHWAIVNRVAENLPQVLFIDGCPLCWVADDHEANCKVEGCPVTRQSFEDWIPGVAAHMREEHERMVAEDNA